MLQEYYQRLPYEENNKKKNEDICITFESDDKIVIKFKKMYLQKIEKSIFLFNLKKFEDSFQFLMENQIISNIDEFGEFILVTPGLDKYIIGDFLAKKKPPNKDYIVLKAFMKKIHFEDEKFLDSLRFILSRINLPKDSSLILEIIDKFTVQYYEYHKTIYSHSDHLYTLSSTILAINTMMHKADIQNNSSIKPIERETFIRMNEKINQQISGEIYDEIKKNKLDVVYECIFLFTI